MQKNDATGASERELADAFGLSICLTEYHLEVLSKGGLVARIESGEHGRATHSFVATAPAGER